MQDASSAPSVGADDANGRGVGLGLGIELGYDVGGDEHHACPDPVARVKESERLENLLHSNGFALYEEHWNPP